jgi:uncharacterized membrane protein YphA (DoxX/SURF4 family)
MRFEDAAAVKIMHTIQIILQCGVALGLLNVWLLRANQSTSYRGGNAQTMRQEFAAYGLPPLAMYVVGTLKVGAAFCLIAGVWWPPLVFPAALLVAILMVGALAMHVRISDPFGKSIPAAALLLICGAILFLDRH